jgi:cytochrome c-type biogenesis protein CcmH
LALLATGLLLVAMAFAETKDARFDRLGHKLMCRCGCNQILLECNHVGCQYSDKMRQELMAAINDPNNDDLILQSFVQEYGAVVLAAPTNTGFNRAAWITPFAALALGIGAVVLVVRRWKARAPHAAPAAGPAASALDDFREQARKETEL